MNWLKNFNSKFIANKKYADKYDKELYIAITTNSSSSERKPYLTPTRTFNNFIVFGIVVYYQYELKEICKIVEGKIKLLFVDAEKKIPIETHKKILNPNKKDIIKHNRKKISNEYIELGNLVSICNENLSKTKFVEFKPNDITVNNAWLEVANHFKVLSKKKIAIIGAGNIGFKLALKLVETGCNINIFRRQLEKCIMLSNAINLVKPISTIASSSFFENKIKACLFVDAIIGSSNEQNSINLEMIKVMKPNGIILDIGKGTIKKDAIKYAKTKKIKVIRCDISASLTNFIFEYINYKDIKKSRGRKKILKDIYISSGGYMAEENDIIVDNFQKPKEIICVADGNGSAKKVLTKKNKYQILKLNKFLKVN